MLEKNPDQRSSALELLTFLPAECMQEMEWDRDIWRNLQLIPEENYIQTAELIKNQTMRRVEINERSII